MKDKGMSLKILQNNINKLKVLREDNEIVAVKDSFNQRVYAVIKFKMDGGNDSASSKAIKTLLNDGWTFSHIEQSYIVLQREWCS